MTSDDVRFDVVAMATLSDDLARLPDTFNEVRNRAKALHSIPAGTLPPEVQQALVTFATHSSSAAQDVSDECGRASANLTAMVAAARELEQAGVSTFKASTTTTGTTQPPRPTGR